MVLLVMREAVENFSNSWLEKLTTFWNTSFLRFFATPAAVREAKSVTMMVASMAARARPSIFRPVITIYWI